MTEDELNKGMALKKDHEYREGVVDKILSTAKDDCLAGTIIGDEILSAIAAIWEREERRYSFSLKEIKP